MSGGAKEYADAAAQAIRLLNHATIGPGALTTANEVDEVLVELAQLASRLPQAIDQTTRGLLELLNAGQLEHDAGLSMFDLDGEIDEAATLLGNAIEAAQSLYRALDAARQITSHLSGGAR